MKLTVNPRWLTPVFIGQNSKIGGEGRVKIFFDFNSGIW